MQDADPAGAGRAEPPREANGDAGSAPDAGNAEKDGPATPIRPAPYQIREMIAGLPGLDYSMIFDVGANVGQSARQYLQHFGDAAIHCFEPVSTTFARLTANVGGESRVTRNNFALGDTACEAVMTARPGREGNRIIDPEDRRARRATELVPVQRGDDYCDHAGIGRINFLKIDTEGFDLNVLVGFARMLEAQRIDLIQVEAGMHSGNAKHVHLCRFMEHLEPLGYHLFRVFGQTFEFDGRPILRRANPVFVASRTAAALARPRD